LGNLGWYALKDLARKTLPKLAEQWLARAEELDKQALALDKLVAESRPAARLRREAQALRQQVAAVRRWLSHPATPPDPQWFAPAVDWALMSPEGQLAYGESSAYRRLGIPAVRFGGYAHPTEVTNEARAVLLLTMTELAIKYRHPKLRQLFGELYALWRTRQCELGDAGLSQDGLGGVDRDALYRWAQRWYLVAPDGRIPDWILAQVEATCRFWQVMGRRGERVPLCWPIIASDVWGYPALSPEEQQRAEQFCRQHPDFCILTVRNREEWHLHRHFARVAGMRIAPRVPLAHLVWVCRYQCGQERASDIANEAGCTRQAAHHAVRRTLALVGLRPRRGDKRGPRSGSRRAS